MITVFQGKAPKLLLALTVGLTAAVLARVAIFIATSPHSALTLFSDLWQLPASFGMGIIAFAFCYRSAHRHTLLTSITSFLALSFGVVLHWFVFNIPLAQQFLPGIWVK